MSPSDDWSENTINWLRASILFGEGVLISGLAGAGRLAQQDTLEQAAKQEALAKLSQLALNHSTGLTQLCDTAVALVAETLGGTHATAFLTVDDRLQMRGSYGWLPETFEKHPTGSLEETQAGYTLRTRDAVVVPDIRKETRFKIHPALLEHDIRFCATVLIGSSAEPFGVLGFLDTKPRKFDADDIQFEQAVANILAVAIERSRAEAARAGSDEKLRVSEERYRTFFEQSTEAIWRMEMRTPVPVDLPEDEILAKAAEVGYLAECNDAFARMYGYESASELAGARLTDFLSLENPQNDAYLRAFIRSGFRLSEVESVELDRDGQVHRFSNTLIGMVENGALVRAWGTQRDITEAKQAAEELRASEERFRALFDAAPVPIVITRVGRILYANGATVRLLGCARVGELVGRDASEFIEPDEAGQMEEHMPRRTGEPSGDASYETTALRKDGNRFPVRIEVAQIDLPDGAASLAFVFDLTAIRRNEAERSRMLDRERRAADRAVRLQEVTAALAASATTDQVVAIVVQQGVTAAGAYAGSLAVPAGDALSIVRSTGYPTELVSRFSSVPVGSQFPIARAFRQRSPLWITDAPSALEIPREMHAVFEITGSQSVVCLPLIANDRILGIFSLSYKEQQEFDEEERAFQLTLAAQCAQALERARSDEAQHFFAEAGSALVASLDESDVYTRLANLCVPRVADWCLVALPEADGTMGQVFLAQRDASKLHLAARLKDLLGRDPNLPWDVIEVMKARRSLLYQQNSQTKMKTEGGDYRRLLLEMDIRSTLLVPLAARGRVSGVLIWLTAESGRTYDEKDIGLAEELARRAALTADNARLYQESRQARDEAQTALSAARTARDEAENANRAKDEFLAVVSHELRTPLTPIMGWIELLRSPNIPEDSRVQAYDVIERNAKAQAQLVNDILDVSRITTGKLRLEFRPVGLSTVVERAVEALRSTAAAKQLTLEIALEDVGKALIDGSRIQQVVWNLLQNAIKFTPDGGKITVSLTRNADEAVLRLKDSGVGIAHEFLPHVFDRFRQADSSATRPAGGLGLGLAIVQHIVSLHGGRVYADSPGEGRGATFSVHLPLEQRIQPAVVSQPAPPTPVDMAASAAKKSGLSLPRLPASLNLMVVDDDPDTREMLAHLLALQGARVWQAQSGFEALQMVEQDGCRPDAIISDIGMPGLDGYHLRRHMRVLMPNMPMVALTAYAAATDKVKALEAGFDKYLAKPVDPMDVLLTIRELVQISEDPVT